MDWIREHKSADHTWPDTTSADCTRIMLMHMTGRIPTAQEAQGAVLRKSRDAMCTPGALYTLPGKGSQAL